MKTKMTKVLFTTSKSGSKPIYYQWTNSEKNAGCSIGTVSPAALCLFTGIILVPFSPKYSKMAFELTGFCNKRVLFNVNGGLLLIKQWFCYKNFHLLNDLLNKSFFLWSFRVLKKFELIFRPDRQFVFRRTNILHFNKPDNEMFRSDFKIPLNFRAKNSR